MFQARAARSSTRAQHFYIIYNTLHYSTFRMSGRSFLCDLWFSQTLRHKNYMYYILPKTKKFGCVSRGDLTFLFKSSEIDKVRGDVSSNV